MITRAIFNPFLPLFTPFLIFLNKYFFLKKMENINLSLTSSNLTKDQVKQLLPIIRAKLESQEFLALKQQSAQRGRYTSKAYAVYRFIYDRNNQWLQHWRQCIVCKDIRYIKTGLSLFQLT